MPWNDNLVNAFPIPTDKLEKLSINPPHLVIGDKFTGPFPFFSLPPELRNRVYELVLFSNTGHRGKSRISLLCASKRCHTEAAHVLYASNHFRIFPLQDFSPMPTVKELPIRYRKSVANLELVLGSSWTNPPKSWKVTKVFAKRLASLDAVQTLRIFVQVDPSHPVFQWFRISPTFYTDYCGNLIDQVLTAMPQIRYVELDGNPSVELKGPLVEQLRSKAEEHKKIIKWGKERGWAYEVCQLAF